MKIYWNKKILAVSAAMIVGVLMTGCGGDSTSSVSEATNLTLTKIDTTNQDKVTAALFDSVDITTPQLPSIRI